MDKTKTINAHQISFPDTTRQKYCRHIMKRTIIYPHSGISITICESCQQIFEVKAI